MAQLVKKDDAPKKKKGKKKPEKNHKKKHHVKKLKEKSPKKKLVDAFSAKKLHMDSRVYIQYSEFNQRCMDGFFFTKKQKQRLSLNSYLRSEGNQLSEHESIPYMNIAYVVLEMFNGTEFPNLGLIKDPFKKGKPAIVKVGSESDDMPKEIQERDLEVILKDLSSLKREIVCYRIRRRVYERLMHHYMWESVPMFTSTTSKQIRASSILYPLQAVNNGEQNFFRYLVGGHLILKNGDCYRLTSMDVGFDNCVQQVLAGGDDSR